MIHYMSPDFINLSVLGRLLFIYFFTEEDISCLVICQWWMKIMSVYMTLLLRFPCHLLASAPDSCLVINVKWGA